MVILNIVKIKLPVLVNLVIGLFGQFYILYKTPVFFTMGSTKWFIQCFPYSISVQIIICDILYRLSLPLVFETFVTVRQLKRMNLLFITLSAYGRSKNPSAVGVECFSVDFAIDKSVTMCYNKTVFKLIFQLNEDFYEEQEVDFYRIDDAGCRCGDRNGNSDHSVRYR